MNVPIPARHIRFRLFLLLLPVMLTAAFACGGSSDSDSGSGSEFTQVVDSASTYSLAELETIGYRVSKTYDVNGLIDATEAYYGFWTPPSANDPVDFEVRVYPDHASAVASGTAQAEEVTGDDAVLDRATSSWPEGLTNRRRVVGPGASQGSGQPRYPDYVIFGNLVVLCEGRNLDHAREHCNEIVSALQ